MFGKISKDKNRGIITRVGEIYQAIFSSMVVASRSLRKAKSKLGGIIVSLLVFSSNLILFSKRDYII